MDWFTFFGVPFARPPQRVPLGGLLGREKWGQRANWAEQAQPRRSQAGIGHLMSYPYFATTLAKKRAGGWSGSAFSAGSDVFFHQDFTSRMQLAKERHRRSVAKLTNRLSDGLLIRWPTSLTLRSRRRCFLSWKRSLPCGSAFSGHRLGCLGFLRSRRIPGPATAMLPQPSRAIR